MRVGLMKAAIIVAVSVFAGFGVASVTVGASASPEQTAGEVGSTLEISSVDYYETPCYKNARESRGIPPLSVDQSTGYAAWYRNNWGSPEWNDWNEAASRCLQREVIGKWDWNAKILVLSEK